MYSLTENVEEWRPCHIRPEMYEVSSLGRVRRTSRLGKVRVLRPHVTAKGYSRVTLAKVQGGRQTYHLVHRLVAIAFLGPSDLIIRHLDGDPANNRVDNIAWGTYEENSADTIRMGRNRLASRTHCKWGHEFTPENTYPDYRGRGRRCRQCYRKKVSA